MEYLENLNDKQKEAAMHVDGPLLILAGAGSGKTSTMTRRIAYMIREKGISPWEILAVTFTNKAAKEMRERVESLVGGGINMWIMTFHSACLRILRMHADVLGYSKDFTIYDPVDQKAVISAAIKALNVDEKQFKPVSVLGAISDAKEKGMTAREFAMGAGNYPEQIIGKLYMEYERTLKKNSAMDFDDLIWRTVELFEKDPGILEKYRDRFRYIMVDEYQDTNFMQYKFIKMLAEKNKNICVVGDDDQCIYQWRGADIRNILSFEKDFPGTKVVKLEQNYRSKANILKAAHSVIKHNKGRKDKELWTTQDDGSKLMYKRLRNEKEETYTVTGTKQYTNLSWKEEKSHEILEKNIGVINPSSIPEGDTESVVSQIMNDLCNTDGLIIDLRQYPSDPNMHMFLSMYLQKKGTVYSVMTIPSQSVPGTFINRKISSIGVATGAFYYEKPVVLLMDERSMSSSEFSIMHLRTGDHVVVIGSSSAGVDGNVTELPLPNGNHLRFTSFGVYTPEMGQTQRVGLAPDIEVYPTIEGIKEGRDELMEAAVDYILSQNEN